ncbi:uncharacterized protein LOC127529610 [Erpetoichthys calabaricus]|uniref:uncharacterized protein LOC127529610 n=1 Tax=Erpetoichthys calabaricus TaxID=27687 RepID=UPI0022340FAC|nr:uncharacterized protein LOC127529610 [Erpetoichthys calabaricus]
MCSKLVLVFGFHLFFYTEITDCYSVQTWPGSSIALPCELKNGLSRLKLDGGLSWYRCFGKKCDQLLGTISATGNIIHITEDRRISIARESTKQHNYSLVIHDVWKADQGSYQCLMYDAKGIVSMQTILLQVLEAKDLKVNTEPAASWKHTITQPSYTTEEMLEKAPLSMTFTVLLSCSCVALLLLIPFVCLCYQYKTLQQRVIATPLRPVPDVQEGITGFMLHGEHIYSEIHLSDNENALQRSLSVSDYEYINEGVDYEILSKVTRSVNDVYSTLSQGLEKRPHNEGLDGCKE